MNIRKAVCADVEAIARVHVESWRTTYRHLLPADFLAGLSYEQRVPFWKRTLCDEETSTFVFVVENEAGEVVAFASGGPNREFDPNYQGVLYAIYILESYQGKGMGRQLVTKVMEQLKDSGINNMFLWVLAENPSRYFYEKMGGQLLYNKQIEIGGATLEELAYGWPDIKSNI